MLVIVLCRFYVPIVKQKSKFFCQNFKRLAARSVVTAVTAIRPDSDGRKISVGAIASYWGALVANFYYYRKQAKLKTVIVTVLDRDKPRNNLFTTTYSSREVA